MDDSTRVISPLRQRMLEDMVRLSSHPHLDSTPALSRSLGAGSTRALIELC
jgi:hypothetical protein